MNEGGRYFWRAWCRISMVRGESMQTSGLVAQARSHGSDADTMTHEECRTLSEDILELGRGAVEETVREKIQDYVRSRNKNWFKAGNGSREAI